MDFFDLVGTDTRAYRIYREEDGVDMFVCQCGTEMPLIWLHDLDKKESFARTLFEVMCGQREPCGIAQWIKDQEKDSP